MKQFGFAYLGYDSVICPMSQRGMESARIQGFGSYGLVIRPHMHRVQPTPPESVWPGWLGGYVGVSDASRSGAELGGCHHLSENNPAKWVGKGKGGCSESFYKEKQEAVENTVV